MLSGWRKKARSTTDHHPSKETGAGSISENAVHYLEEATMEIQGAIECMQYAVGDDSPPEPPILPSSGGVYENHPKSA
jgi:hypothetical protein